ncbi:hypothetical protein TRFO_03745 [Tritrichomonas foetus]|uniref:Uncharacterized protein n=1 Tax=Tritrichomonas foetus TaxID=1144522 RepID=A0A1J4KLM1_9EUKA|nr:hypothetical protein TRFO_03745 [Tritrichomonas foetus]|eukprot:OHT12115.1 hypothetical protein TRFO_03745 [Tritrichomonas foetus]
MNLFIVNLSKLIEFFEGRSEIDLKNRYFLILRRAKCEDSCPNNSFNASNQQQTIENPNFKIVPNCFIPSNILNNSIFILNGLNLNCINIITNFNSQDNIPNSSANTRGINYGIPVINYGIINNSNSSMIGSVNPNTSENTILIGNVMNDHLNGFQSAILISNQTTQLNEINGLNLVKTNMISDDYRPNNSSYCQATKNTINFQLPKIEENNEKQLNSEELSTDNLNKEISNSSCTSLPNIDEFLHQIQKA